MDAAVQFEWDDAKAAGNLAKHGIPFDEAIAVFLDADRVEFDVSREGENEERRKVVGRIEGRLFSVVYTLRESRLRMISARRANAKEESFYETRDT